MAGRHLPERVRGVVGESDLVQIAMMKVVRGVGSTAAVDVTQYRGWLRTLLKRVGIDAYRTHAREPSRTRQLDLDMHALVDKRHSPSHDAAACEEQAQLQRAIARLPGSQQQALRLYLEDQSTAQIARTMRRSEQAAAGLVKRALVALRHGS